MKTFFKKSSVLICLLGSMALTSCSSELDNNGGNNSDDTSTYKPTLITPTGAPTLPAYKAMISENIDVISPAENTAIPAYLSSGNADFVIFDAGNAQKILNKAGSEAKFEFVKMLTGGNFHLLGFNKTSEDVPSDDDVIYGFMETSTPGILFRNIYGSDLKFDLGFDSIASLQTSLLTMKDYKINGATIDWAVVAEPANTALQAKLKANGNTNILDINLNSAFKEKNSQKWNKDYIVQAGLFVNKEFKQKYSAIYDSTIKLINNGIDTLFTDLDSAYNEMTSGEYQDATAFQKKFGFAPTVIKNVQGTNSEKNGFGVVPNNVTFTVDDINLFNSLTSE